MMRKKTGAIIIIILYFILIIVQINIHSYALQYNEPNTDCQFLFYMTNRVLVLARSEPEKALEVSKTLIGINISGDLGRYHKLFYKNIINYLNLKVRHKYDASDIDTLTAIYKNLYIVYNNYISELSRCPVESELFATLGSSNRLILAYNILPDIEDMISMILSNYSSSAVELSVDKVTVRPLEEVNVNININNINFNNIEIILTTWPTLEFIRYVNYTLENNVVHAFFKAPVAKELGNVPEVIMAATQVTRKIAVIVKVYSDGGEVLAFKVVRIIYKVPSVIIDVPKYVVKGDRLNFTIISDGYYENVSIYVDGELLNITSLREGENRIVTRPITSDNIVLISLIIRPGLKYVGLERYKPVAVYEPPVKYDLTTSGVLLTVNGNIVFRVNGTFDRYPAYIEAKTGPIILKSMHIADESVTVSFFASILPITIVSIEVNYYTIGVERSTSIIVVNPFYLIIILIITLIISGYHSPMEKLVYIILGLPQRGRLGYKKAGKSNVPIKYTYKIKSKIVRLYYKLLLRLGYRLPYPHETLREHFNDIPVRGKGRDSMKQLMHMAEEDLYSNRSIDLTLFLNKMREVLRK